MSSSDRTTASSSSSSSIRSAETDASENFLTTPIITSTTPSRAAAVLEPAPPYSSSSWSLTRTIATKTLEDDEHDGHPHRRRRNSPSRSPDSPLLKNKNNINFDSSDNTALKEDEPVCSTTATTTTTTGHVDDDSILLLEGSSSRNRNKPGRVGALCAYWNVLVRYPMFRYYLLSHFCQNMGDWLVRVASLLEVEKLSSFSRSSTSSSGSSLSHLVVAVMLPKTVFAQVGGFLADRYDRRILMINMNLMAGIVVLGYLYAVQQSSLPLLYLVSILRSAIGSAYYPATHGLLPLLVPPSTADEDDDSHHRSSLDLQLAVTMNTWTWSLMAILGGTVAGSASAFIGLQACYVLDSVTFFISAWAVWWGISGNFNVHTTTNNNNNRHSTAGGNDRTAEATGAAAAPVEGDSSAAERSFSHAVRQLVVYLSSCGFGLMVLMKASGSLIWGPEDLIGVNFSTVSDDTLGQEDQASTSWRTGVLFSVTGIGTLLGPTLSNLFSSSSGNNKSVTLQHASWVGLIFLTLGWMLISGAPNFTWFLIFTLIRTMGTGMVWVNSTVALQTLTENEFLGRVLAVEFTSYTLVEAASATLAGILFDVAGLDKNQLALLPAAFGIIMVILWGHYFFHLRDYAAVSSVEMPTVLAEFSSESGKGEMA